MLCIYQPPGNKLLVWADAHADDPVHTSAPHPVNKQDDVLQGLDPVQHPIVPEPMGVAPATNGSFHDSVI
jgi:hypothetical protein